MATTDSDLSSLRIDRSSYGADSPRKRRSKRKWIVWIAVVVLLAAAALPCFAQNYTNWNHYGGSSDSAQFSGLTQINRSNVSRLEKAWSYPTGDGRRYFFAPIVVDNVAYVLANNYGMGPQGVFWAITISFSLLAVTSALMFNRGKWKLKQV